ncbi:hypothetical protein GCM10027440_00970 [Nocardiopsis coralliicola]
MLPGGLRMPADAQDPAAGPGDGCGFGRRVCTQSAPPCAVRISVHAAAVPEWDRIGRAPLSGTELSG